MIHYRALFNGVFHHEYYMDRGETRFQDLAASDQERILRNYSISDYLKVYPTFTTARLLENNRILFKPNASGFRLLASCTSVNVSGTLKYCPQIPIDQDLALNFMVYATDPYFEHYSLTSSKDNNQLYFFTNAPAQATIGSANVLSEDGTVDSTFLLTVPESRRLMHQLAMESVRFDSLVDPYSIAAIPISDLDTAETMGRLHPQIQSAKRGGLLGVLRLYITGDNAKHLLEIDASDPADIKQYTLSATPEATLKFKNRTTFWRYITKATNTVWTTTAKKPLTKNGFVAIENTDLAPQPVGDLDFPNPDIQFIKKESSDYYSEIYL